MGGMIFGGAGAWGPEPAETLMAQEGHTRLLPTFLQGQADQPVCLAATVQP